MTDTFKAAIAEAGLSIKAVFVPFSQSRNAVRAAGEDPRTDKRGLNWKVTLLRNGREILTTDYSAGIGHCPAYKLPVKDAGSIASIMREGIIALEIEGGFAVKKPYEGARSWVADKSRPLLPNDADVIYSLIRDANTIDYPTYEEWASEYGYDTDSRKGEAIYQACIEIGLKLRAALGDKMLQNLQEAAQDY